jgi:hypothetical protein
MVFEAETASPRSILTTSLAKKEVIETGLTIIIPDMIGMLLCAAPLPSSEI